MVDYSGTWGYYTGYEQASGSGGTNSVHILVGFFFALNYMLGYGFLAVPYAVHHTGLAFGWAFVLAISTMCCCTAWWTLEVMARAQALEYWRNTRTATRYVDPAQTVNDDSPAVSDGEDPSPSSSIRLKCPVPIYEIENTRKFELTELCEIFLGSTGKVLYILVLCLQLLVTCWLYITVAVTSWSINIPWNISASAHVCNPEEFHNVILPISSECRTTYRFYVFAFALIIVPLSCIDFRKQKFFQVFTTMFRFMAVLLMTSHAIYYFIKEEVQARQNGNFSATNNGSTNTLRITESRSVFIHHGTTWLLCIPVLVYAQTLHQAIPAICHVVKKQYSYKHLFTWAFMTTGLLYCVYGTTVAFVFSHKTMENSALNWVPFTNSDNIAESVIAYIIVIFPSIDVCSVFPLVTVTLGNNLYSALVGHDTSVTELDQGQTDNKRKILYRIMISITSVILALFMANLVQIVKVCGIFSFLIVFVFPALLQYKSRRKCKRVFGRGDRLTEHACTIRGWHKVDSGRKGFSPTMKDINWQPDKDTPYSSVFSFSFCSILIGCTGILMLGATGVTLIVKSTG